MGEEFCCLKVTHEFAKTSVDFKGVAISVAELNQVFHGQRRATSRPVFGFGHHDRNVLALFSSTLFHLGDSYFKYGGCLIARTACLCPLMLDW